MAWDQKEGIRLRKSISDVTLQVNVTNNITEGINESDKDSIVQVKCECCGLEEECSHDYLNKIKEMYFEKWVCGLCSEAIKERLMQSSSEKSMKDALRMHKEFCEEFNASIRSNPKLSLTWALRDIARRSSLHRRSLSENQMPASRLIRSASCDPRIDVEFGGKE
ncbi:uncharacterized protein LOC141614495 [Silene latifolia]|uniref:uncharacterized protein LOC141614495 n=1 Tax=Silene latifolia TaxID=37657 RepID=UPI003D783B1D